MACYRRIACGVVKKGVFATQTWGGGKILPPPTFKSGGAIAPPPAPPAPTPMSPGYKCRTKSDLPEHVNSFSLKLWVMYSLVCSIGAPTSPSPLTPTSSASCQRQNRALSFGKLDEFVNVKKIAEGTYGQVYKAKDTKTGMHAAAYFDI